MNSSVIYFVQGVDGGPVKIGVSQNAAHRLKDLQAHSPVKLRLLGVAPGTIFEERKVHERLAAHRLHGEWFADCAEVHAELEALSHAAVKQPEDEETFVGLTPAETVTFIRLARKWLTTQVRAWDADEADAA